MSRKGGDALVTDERVPLDIIRYAALAGFIGPLVSLLFITIAIITTPWFSFYGHALSDLGRWGEPGAAWFNIGVSLAGLCSLTFALGLRKLLGQRSKHENAGTLVLALGAVCLILVGFFALESRTSTITTPGPRDMAHIIVALGFFILTPTGMLLLGWTWLERKPFARMGRFTLLLSLALLVGLVGLFLVGGLEFEALAVPESIAVAMMASWQMGLSYGLRKLDDPETTASRK